MAGTKVSFYHGHPDTGTLLGTVDLGRLEAGAYEDVSFTWTNPPSGLQEIYVRVDDEGTGHGSVLESNEDNNLAGVSVIIGNTKPIAKAGDDQTVYWGADGPTGWIGFQRRGQRPPDPYLDHDFQTRRQQRATIRFYRRIPHF